MFIITQEKVVRWDTAGKEYGELLDLGYPRSLPVTQ